VTIALYAVVEYEDGYEERFDYSLRISVFCVKSIDCKKSLVYPDSMPYAWNTIVPIACELEMGKMVTGCENRRLDAEFS
jgi:hypothetical protein